MGFWAGAVVEGNRERFKVGWFVGRQQAGNKLAASKQLAVRSPGFLCDRSVVVGVWVWVFLLVCNDSYWRGEGETRRGSGFLSRDRKLASSEFRWVPLKRAHVLALAHQPGFQYCK